MRLPHFRLRALLIAAAVVAIVLGGGLGYVRMNRRARQEMDRRVRVERWAEFYSGLASDSKAYATEWDRRAAQEADPIAAEAARGHARDHLVLGAWAEASANRLRDGLRKNPPRLRVWLPRPASLIQPDGQMRLPPPPPDPDEPGPPEPEPE
jgi:hypothetical protein